MRHATNGARIAHHGLLSTGSTLNACELAGSRLVRAQACDQLTAIALHADTVWMERPIHGATPKPCRERRARQPNRRSSDANPALRNPHAGHGTDARPPNPERRRSECLRLAVAALHGRTHGIRERVIGPFPRAPIGDNATVDQRATPVRPRRIPRSGVPHGRCPRRVRTSQRSLYAAGSASWSIRCGAGRWGTPAAHHRRPPLAWDGRAISRHWRS
jgi:hypothetical protein